MRRSQNEGFGWIELLLAIIFFIAAYFAFTNPATTIQTISILLGITALIRGILAIANYVRGRNNNARDRSSGFQLALGIIAILAGLVFLFFSGLGTIVLSIAFAVWFFVECIEGLTRAPRYKQRSNALYWISIILNVLGIIVGILLILNPWTAFFAFSYLIAFAFLYFGILNLFMAFA